MRPRFEQLFEFSSGQGWPLHHFGRRNQTSRKLRAQENETFGPFCLIKAWISPQFSTSIDSSDLGTRRTLEALAIDRRGLCRQDGVKLFDHLDLQALAYIYICEVDRTEGDSRGSSSHVEV